ncbi:MAG: hypothetical protein MK329_16015 [Pirellulales bacterium]|nr:hypothetical protein [Pirellulales bacterium]
MIHSTGRVWVAKDLLRDTDVALKELIESNEERSPIRFLRGAKLTETSAALIKIDTTLALELSIRRT